MKLNLVLVFLLVFCSQSFAGLGGPLQVLFESTFMSSYEEGRCGDNITGLIQKAHRQGMDLTRANVLMISNKGFSLFGLINVEYARSSGRLNPDYPELSEFRNLPGERNWYHHVILEMDGFIFDYDFGNMPVVLSVGEYFEQMFLDEESRPQDRISRIGRAEKLKGYEVEVVKAMDIIKAREQRIRTPDGKKMRLFQYLEKGTSY